MSRMAYMNVQDSQSAELHAADRRGHVYPVTPKAGVLGIPYEGVRPYAVRGFITVLPVRLAGVAGAGLRGPAQSPNAIPGQGRG